MTDTKARRQRAIEDLVRSARLASQDQLAARLKDLGFTVTQATISRDLEELGAVKVRQGGDLVYAMPDQLGSVPQAARQLAAIVREWVRSIEAAGNLIVLKTPPGSAHLVGVALDQADLPDVAGTICGDDTIFVAARDPSRAKALAAELGGFGQLASRSPLGDRPA